jgi:hypothetical protein
MLAIDLNGAAVKQMKCRGESLFMKGKIMNNYGKVAEFSTLGITNMAEYANDTSLLHNTHSWIILAINHT